MCANPFAPFLERQGFLVLDGGLATEMEVRGQWLGDDLWSARMLFDDPALIREIHLAYLRAGSDCITTATYQATTLGLMRRGFSEVESAELMRLATRLALDARDDFWHGAASQGDRVRPVVAASIGPYGAYLADGSEYTGDYGLSEHSLYEFHKDRWYLLARSGVDLVACETIPSLVETRSLSRLIVESGDTPSWVSFSCNHEGNLRDGTPLEEAIATVSHLDQVLAVGVNCIPPNQIAGLIVRMRSLTEKPIVVYPNRGEGWDRHCRRPGEGSPRVVRAGSEGDRWVLPHRLC